MIPGYVLRIILMYTLPAARLQCRDSFPSLLFNIRKGFNRVYLRNCSFPCRILILSVTKPKPRSSNIHIHSLKPGNPLQPVQRLWGSGIGGVGQNPLCYLRASWRMDGWYWLSKEELFLTWRTASGEYERNRIDGIWGARVGKVLISACFFRPVWDKKSCYGDGICILGKTRISLRYRQGNGIRFDEAVNRASGAADGTRTERKKIVYSPISPLKANFSVLFSTVLAKTLMSKFSPFFGGRVACSCCCCYRLCELVRLERTGEILLLALSWVWGLFYHSRCT